MPRLEAQPYEDALAAAEAAGRVAQAEVDKLHGGLRPQEVAQTREALNRARAAATEAGRHDERQAGLMPAREISRSPLDAARATRDQAAPPVPYAQAALAPRTADRGEGE